MEKQNAIITGEDLLEVLEKEYKDEQPMVEVSPFDQGVAVGCKTVIEHIRSLLK